MIVDANSAHELSLNTVDGKPVLRWLLSPKERCGLVLGGKLVAELAKAGLRSTLIELSRAGRLHRLEDTLLSCSANID